MSKSPPAASSFLRCEPLEDRLVPNATSFVTSLYNNLLYRAPDASGLTYWVDQLKSGALTDVQVAQDFWRSPEHRGVEVDFYYSQFLGRPADPAGRAFWISKLENGMTELEVAGQFLTSAEFLADHDSAVAYIDALYAAILNRPPSLSDLSYWGNILASQGDGAVTIGILTSTEAYTGIVDNDYVNYLGRLPDSGGLSYWVTQLQNGTGSVESVAEGILGSAEYAALH